MKYLTITICLLAVGCACPRRVLSQQPQYFQDNIGDIKYQPLNPLGLIFRGMVQTTDPDGTIYLYLLADDNILLEEAFHSFEIRAGHNRYAEWEQFYFDFHSDGSTYKDYGGVKLSLLTWACWPFLNGLSHNVSHFEDTAYHYVALVEGREIPGDKTKAVRSFINGAYAVIDY